MAESSAPNQQSVETSLSLTKRIVFMCIPMVLGLAMVEGGAHLAYRFMHGSGFAHGAYRAKLSAIRASLSGNMPDSIPRDSGELEFSHYTEVIHPFLGYVRDPSKNIALGSTNRASPYGFADNADPVVKRSDDTLVVGIFGGSFAQQMTEAAGDELSRALSSAGRRVVLRNYALAGYKQPQQLMALSYLFLLGAEFDVVINIDGFNEIVLSVTDNQQYDVFPLFPRGWAARVAAISTLDELRTIGALTRLDAKREALCDYMLSWGLYRSCAVTMLWDAWDTRLLRQRIRLAGRTEHALCTSDTRYVATGPQWKHEPGLATYRRLAAMWKRGSMLMCQLCQANGARYFHFLQPNQYVEGSKPLSSRERREAIDFDHKYGASVLAGYPFLSQEAATLALQWPGFHDLTRVFEDHTETLYKDTCCHLNDKGYRLIARIVADAVRRETTVARAQGLR